MLLLLMLSPLAVFAQVDDIYFVPERETRVLVVRSTEEAYFVDADELESETELIEPVYDEVETEAYFTNDLDVIYDEDYRFSSRIIRFRSPGRLLTSNLYWGLHYDCGINDWLVYDNGYTIDIYPTSVNPLYWASSWSYASYNYWNWHSYYRPHYWYDDYWYCHSPHHWYDNHYWHNHHWHNHYYGHNDRWAHSIPTNGSVAGRHNREHNMVPPRNPNRGRPSSSTVVGGRGDRDNNAGGEGVGRRPMNDRNNNAVVGTAGNRPGSGNGAGRRPSTSRENIVQSGNTGASAGNGRENGVRRQPSTSRSNSSSSVEGTGSSTRTGRETGVRRQPSTSRDNNSRVGTTTERQNRNTSVRSNNERRQNSSVSGRSNSSSRSSYSNSSSGRSSRPSSTSVTRTGGSSSSRSSMRSSSGSSSRSSGSSRSSSGGGGSRSSGGGSSRSSGGRR